MKTAELIEIERLKTLLDYNPETGIFIWKVSTNRSIKVGDTAGSLNPNGYILIRVDGKRYRAHRLAYAFEYGYFPKEIDHKNRNRSDNRIKNLRDVTRKENQKNKSMYSRNTSGFTGVHWHKSSGKWYAQIKADDKVIHLGTFTHKNDAIQARKNANLKYGFSQGHGTRKVS